MNFKPVVSPNGAGPFKPISLDGFFGGITQSTFAQLPAAATSKGAKRYITDGAANPTFGAIAAGGGTLFTPVYCDGTTWRNG